MTLPRQEMSPAFCCFCEISALACKFSPRVSSCTWWLTHTHTHGYSSDNRCSFEVTDRFDHLALYQHIASAPGFAAIYSSDVYKDIKTGKSHTWILFFVVVVVLKATRSSLDLCPS